MSESGDYATVTIGDFQVSSSSESKEALQANLGEPSTATVVDGESAPDGDDKPVAPGRDENGRFKAAAAPESDEKPKADAKPRNDPRARVEQATAQAAQARREAAEVRAELDRLRAENESLKRPAASTVAKALPDAGPAEPDPAKYPEGHYDPKYIRDLARYEADRRDSERETERQQVRDRDAAEHADRTMRVEWQGKLDAIRKEIPDYDARVVPTTPIDLRVAPWLMAQDEGPRVILYLSEHQDIAQRLATLHPVAQIGEFGKIIARLPAASDSGPVAKSVIPSKASTPMQPLGGGSSASLPDDGADDESFDAHFSRENAREKKSASGRR